MDKRNELGSKPIGSLLIKLSAPAIIAMIVNAIYNVVDRMFVGQYVGEEALAGLTIVFPVMMIFFAFCGLAAIGGSVLISIYLGANDLNGARKALANDIFMGVILSAVTLFFIFINMEKVLILFGAEPEFMDYAVDYLKIILTGFMFQMLAFTLNSAVRAEGRALFAMITMVISAITNIILDYVFIVILDLGVSGAALATVIGQITGLIILIGFYTFGKPIVKISFRKFKPNSAILKKIFAIGISASIANLSTSLAMIILNTKLIEYGGLLAIASLGAINSLYTLFIMPLFGLQQGMQPIIGFNYGAKQMKRTYRTLKLGLLASVTFSIIVFILFEAFPETFILMFLKDESEAISIAVTGFRIFILGLPLLSLNILGIAFYQSTGNAKKAIFLSLLRQFIFLIPAIYLLAPILGLNGVWLATPVADYCAIIITIIMFTVDYRRDRVKVESLEEV